MKNPVSAIYCDCFQAFVEGERFFGEDTDRFLAKMLFGVSNVCNTYSILNFFAWQSVSLHEPFNWSGANIILY